MPLKVKTKRELERWTDKSHKQQIETMPEPDVLKHMLKRIKALERKVKKQDKRIKELEVQSRLAWKFYGEAQRNGLLQPDGGEEGF